MAFKLAVLGLVGLVVLSCFGNVNGLKCYVCEQVDLPASLNMTEETCNYKIPRGLTTDCPTSMPYCFKMTGTVMNGKYFESRGCAGKELKDVLVGDKGCRSAKKMDILYVEITKRMGIEIWDACVCDTDKCNPATHVYPVYTFIIAGAPDFFL